MDGAVAALQAQLSALVRNIEDRVDESVSQIKVDAQLLSGRQLANGGELLRSDAQHSASQRKSDWAQLRSLCRCADKQIEQQANYQLFYQTLREYQVSLHAAFNNWTLPESIESGSGTEGREGKLMFDSMQKLVTLVLQWWQRIDSLIVQSRKVLPMAARLTDIDAKRPGKMLTDCLIDGIRLSTNEDIFIVDNSSSRSDWLIETARGQRLSAPSVCLSISGPDPEVMERALSVRLQLLAHWTAALKQLGRRLVTFVLMAFKEAAPAELRLLTNGGSCERGDMQPLLELMEQQLAKHWTEGGEADELSERIRKTRVALAIFDEDEEIDDCTHIDINTLFLQLSPHVLKSENVTEISEKEVSLLTRKYQEVTRYWEIYRVLVETCNDPNYFWLMEEFQKLQHINVTELLNFLGSEDKDVWSKYMQKLAESQRLPKPAVAAAEDNNDNSNVNDNLQRRYERIRLPQLQNGEGANVLIDVQASATFVQPQRPPTVGEEVTAQLINIQGNNNNYLSTAQLTVNSQRPDQLSLKQRESREPVNKPPPSRSPSTLSNASAKASPHSPRSTSAEIEEFTRDQVEQSSRLTISGVKDTYSDTVMSMQEAIDCGIIDSASGSFLNRADAQWLPIPTAIDEGLIMVEQRTQEAESVCEPEVYGILSIRNSGPSLTVTAVHDKLGRSRLSPAEALKAGVANESMTRFFDTERREWLSSDEASERGLIEMDVLSPSSVDSDADSISYMVYSVVDVVAKASVSFVEARRRGLIDVDDGCYVNSRTGDRVEVDEAIRKGFLKAERLNGPPSEALAADRRVVVNRMRSTRKKVKSAMAFRNAAAKFGH